MAKVMGIVPARAGSKRIPGKNMRLLCGQPLIAYALRAALDARLLDRVVVSSDSDEILRFVRSFNQRLVPIRRPSEIAGDESPAIDYVLHSVEFAERYLNYKPDYIAIVQPTSPLTTPDDIDGTIRACIEHNGSSAASVTEVKHHLHPSKYKRIESFKLVNYFSTTQDVMAAHLLDKVYVRNGSVYISRMDAVAQRNLMSEPCIAYTMPIERSLDINDELDFQLAEFLLRQKPLQ